MTQLKIVKILEFKSMAKSKEFDIALSFAGEDRKYVDRLANILRDRGIKVFYDMFEEAELWGKDLYEHLSDVYQNKARFTVIFISASYSKKLWTNLERRAAQARAFQEAQEYILPARFDETEIPGILPTTGYIALKDRTPEDFASVITKKLISSGMTVPTELVRKNYSTIQRFPHSVPTELRVQIRNDESKPIPGATITALADNSTVLDANTGPDGTAILRVHTRRNYRLLVAHPEFPSAMLDRVDPAEMIEVTLPRSENIGSLVIHSTGHIPNLIGRLNPILDTSNRTYLYADNIAINGGVQQPASFKINEPLELEDRNGTVFMVTVKLIAGQTALIQYLRPALLPN
jgi:hypothetical protein